MSYGISNPTTLRGGLSNDSFTVYSNRDVLSLEGVGGAAAVDEAMALLNVAGLLVLQDGKVRLERYARGFGP